MFVYMRTEPGLYTVGHYPGDGERFEPESDHTSEDAAADRCRYLNGGTIPDKNAETLRDRFAMAAPEVPEWFKHEPAPGEPGPLPDANELAGPRPKEEFGAESLAWREKVNAIHKAQHAERENRYQLYAAWKIRDKFARLTQWRYAFADAMLAARDGK